jgi:protocatechuate 3,4-dioxygenase beta subunit
MLTRRGANSLLVTILPDRTSYAQEVSGPVVRGPLAVSGERAEEMKGAAMKIMKRSSHLRSGVLTQLCSRGLILLAAAATFAVTAVREVPRAAAGAEPLPLGPSLSGTVVDEQGRPVTDATVACYHYQIPAIPLPFGRLDEEPESKPPTRTDASGRFAVPASRAATLVVVKAPGLATTWKTWTPFSTPDDSSEPLALSAPSSLTGVVVDENGQPVADAEVWISSATLGQASARGERNELRGQPARASFSARTAADGLFRIGNLPDSAGAMNLGVKKVGKARPSGEDSPAWNYRSGDRDIRLVLGPAGAIEGSVMVRETGQPLPGMSITLWPAAPALYGTRDLVKSGPDGGFRLSDVPPGKYSVLAGPLSPDWVVPESGEVTVTAGETTRNVLLRSTTGALVEVSVVATNTLQPVANAIVTVVSMGDSPSRTSSAFTATNGVAVLRAAPGNAFLAAARSDWLRSLRSIEVPTLGPRRMRIELTPAQRITGTVRDPSGAPAPDVAVLFRPGHYPHARSGMEVRTDANGHYELIPQETFFGGFVGAVQRTNLILARNSRDNLAAIHEFDVFPTNLDLTLQPGITLTGLVQDTEGTPVTNATVPIGRLLPHPTKVDVQGRFSIPALPQGRQYFIEGVTAKGYGTTSRGVLANNTFVSRYEFPPLVLKRADRRLEGKVIDPDGRPIAGARVMASGQGQPHELFTKSDSQGSFAFDAICEGSLQLHASYTYRPPEGRGPTTSSGDIRAQAGDTNVVIQLRAPRR